MPRIIDVSDLNVDVLATMVGRDTYRDKSGRFEKGKHWRKKSPHWEKEWLTNEYVVKKRSAGDIAKDIGIGATAIFYWLWKHGIECRDMAEARSVKHWGSTGEANGMFGRTGGSNPNWRGGVTPERQLFYETQEWKVACRVVWKRDKSTCQLCEMHYDEFKNDYTMHIHHLESFAVVERRADVTNLVLLCELCHNWVHSNENTSRLFLEGSNK